MKIDQKAARLFLFFLFLSTMTFAQGIYYPYYGKNKVIYENFQWKSYPTEHFQVYFYADHVETLKTVAEIAESAYQKISQALKHQLTRPVPLIFYTTYTDFEQTNLFQISEGVLGVSEPILHRIGLHGDMPVHELQDVIEHELSHVFEFDILWGTQMGALYALNQPPLWTFEGLSEYVTQKWSSWSTLIVRDAVLSDRIPELSESGEFLIRFPMPRDPAYDFGHAIYEFLEAKYGKNAIREFWQSMKNSPLIGKRDPLKRTFNLKRKEFNQEFKKFLRERNKEFLTRENPEDYSITLGPEFPMNPYYFSFSHALSPSGDIVATITYNVKDYDIDVVLISTKDGSVIKNITKGYSRHYEYIRYDIDVSNGKTLAWSPDGDRIVFFARDGQKHSLILVDPIRGDTVRKYKILLDQPSGLCFSPDGQYLFFAAFSKGIRDLFKVNLQSGEVLNLTNDDLYEKAPAVSPDGTTLVYTIRVAAFDKIFLSPINDLKKKTQLTFGNGNTVCPQFSPDAKEIYFSGDLRDAYNIYSLNLETREMKRYTDVRTGNFFPCPLPYDAKKIVFSSFNKGSFQLFKGELKGTPEGTLPLAEVKPEETFKKFEPVITLDINQKEIKPYRGIGKLYISSRPPIDAVISTDGSLYGGSALAFSDIMGDHNFLVTAYQVRSFRSYFFAYLNQKRRFQYMINAFEYTQFYYPPYVYYDPSLYASYLTYQDAIATRKIRGLSLSAYYPFSLFYRAEADVGFYNYEEDFLDPYQLRLLSPRSYNYFLNGNMLSATFSLVGETTRFKEYGPAAGNTFRLSLVQAVPFTKQFFSNTTIQADLRKYIHIGEDIILAFRFNGFASLGKNPFVFYFGGNNEVRSAYYYNIVANEGWYANAEIRFPLVNAAATLLGQIGPIRGVLFFDVARSKIKGSPAKFYRYPTFDSLEYAEMDAIGSFGYGIQFFFMGLPLHLEFVKRLEFPEISQPWRYNTFGKFETKFWVGFDF